MSGTFVKIIFVIAFITAALPSFSMPLLRSDGIDGLLVLNNFLVNIRFEANLPLAVYPENGGLIGYGTDEKVLARVEAFNESYYPRLSAPISQAIAGIINSTPEPDRLQSINGCGSFEDYPTCYIFFPTSILFQLSPYTPAFEYQGVSTEVYGSSGALTRAFGLLSDEPVGGWIVTLGVIESVTYISAPKTLFLIISAFVILAVSRFFQQRRVV